MPIIYAMDIIITSITGILQTDVKEYLRACINGRLFTSKDDTKFESSCIVCMEYLQKKFAFAVKTDEGYSKFVGLRLLIYAMKYSYTHRSLHKQLLDDYEVLATAWGGGNAKSKQLSFLHSCVNTYSIHDCLTQIKSRIKDKYRKEKYVCIPVARSTYEQWAISVMTAYYFHCTFKNVLVPLVLICSKPIPECITRLLNAINMCIRKNKRSEINEEIKLAIACLDETYGRLTCTAIHIFKRMNQSTFSYVPSTTSAKCFRGLTPEVVYKTTEIKMCFLCRHTKTVLNLKKKPDNMKIQFNSHTFKMQCMSCSGNKICSLLLFNDKVGVWLDLKSPDIDPQRICRGNPNCFNLLTGDADICYYCTRHRHFNKCKDIYKCVLCRRE